MVSHSFSGHRKRRIRNKSASFRFDVRSETLAAVAPCSLHTDCNIYFLCCEDGVTRLLRNFGDYQPNYATSHTTRPCHNVSIFETWRMKTGIRPSAKQMEWTVAGQRFVKHVPVATNKHREYNCRGTVRHSDLYSVRMKSVQSEIKEFTVCSYNQQ